jgi:tetratricopeptide (TPR) repeat protein
MSYWTCAARLLLSVLGVLALAGPAHAAWIRAETDRFVVYGQGNERMVRDFATKLTTYDWVLRVFHPSTKDRPVGTKVQVFLLSSEGELRRVRPWSRKYTQGFYSAMNEGVFAFAVKNGGGLGSDDVLFHEYAHHFMLENFPVAYPAWFIEGWAEYFMTTEITKDQVKIGNYNQARAYAIFNDVWLPWDDLLSKTTAETRPERANAYYSQAWLLTHYMRSDEKRAAQLDQAIRAIADGKDPVKSFQSATGMTVPELNAALKRYQKLPMIGVGNPNLAPQMLVTALPKSADDLLLDEMRLVLAPTGRVDADFLAGIRRKAAKHPGDALAERTLARAEFVMGDVAAGEAIMRRRLAAKGDDVEDLLLSGSGQIMAGMRNGDEREARYRAARPLLAKAYQLDKDDFRTLYAYALSRSIEPSFPTDNDLAALREARLLAPAVEENSFRLGVALVQKGRRDEAAKVLAPVLNNPHGGRAASMARALLNGERVEAGDVDDATADDGDTEPTPPAKPSPTPVK